MVNQEKMKELDSHWKEVMDLAWQYGFIAQAYGGMAILLTHKNQLAMSTTDTITPSSSDSEIVGQITIEEWLEGRAEEERKKS